MQKIKKKIVVLFLLTSVSLYACAYSVSNSVLQLKSILISGQIFLEDKNLDFPVELYFVIPAPVTGDYREYETTTDSLGRFLFRFESEILPNICWIASSINSTMPIYLPVNKDVVKINLHYDAESMLTGADGDLNPGDAITAPNFIESIMYGRGVEATTNNYFDMAPEAYAKMVIDKIEKQIDDVLKESDLSVAMKSYLTGLTKLYMVIDNLMEYREAMKTNYTNYHGTDSVTLSEIKTPSKAYYAFLKKLHLNDEIYLSCISYPEFLRSVLSNEVLDIPPLGEKRIGDWLQEVKEILSPLTGLDKGLFYDMLAVTAYTNQFRDKSKPLSKVQIEHIQQYFTESSVTELLLNENERIIEIAEDLTAYSVREVPEPDNNDDPEALMEKILTDYKGEIVLVDFWATWCAPCLKAMNEMKHWKSEFSDYNLVYLYLTNSSSPRKIWEEQLPGIGGVHYYLNAEQWNAISSSKKYGFEGVPTYLLFNEQGELIRKISGYPGSQTMKNILLEHLAP